MKVKILPTALEDLDRGRRFYARLDALFSDIDSLELYAGIHMKVFDFHRLLAKRFPYVSITKSTARRASCFGCSTAGKSRRKRRKG